MHKLLKLNILTTDNPYYACTDPKEATVENNWAMFPDKSMKKKCIMQDKLILKIYRLFPT
jgi:hypothetical protein